MKAKFAFLLPIVFLTLLFSSCEDKNELTQEQKDNEHVNNWIYENMDVFYYWRDKMPTSNSVDSKISPDKFFERLLFPYNKTTKEGDRFSWIQPSYVDLINSLSGVSSKEIGFEFIPTYLQEGKDDIGLIVAYLKKGTKAETSGLKRGDIITKVDGIQINKNNWFSVLYQNKSSYQLEGINFSGKITVEPTGNYAENPIYIDNIYTEGSKKIGYIVYNQFTPDNGDKSYSYDKQLANIFAKYETENVSDVILDLRYNGGGYVSCATNIASALVPNRNTKEIFFYKDYNSVFDALAKKELGNDYDRFINDYFRDNILNQKDDGSEVAVAPIPNYGNKINKLYILVSENTASASELIINGLIPFMKDKMYLIGEKTYGKNVGSITLYDEKDSRNKWGMQPIVSRSYNKLNQSDYAIGFTPGIEVAGKEISEFTGILEHGIKPLGDKEETLLAIAIADITGKLKSSVLKRLAAPDVKPIGSSLELKRSAYQMFIDDNKIQRLINIQSSKKQE